MQIFDIGQAAENEWSVVDSHQWIAMQVCVFVCVCDISSNGYIGWRHMNTVNVTDVSQYGCVSEARGK